MIEMDFFSDTAVILSSVVSNTWDAQGVNLPSEHPIIDI